MWNIILNVVIGILFVSGILSWRMSYVLWKDNEFLKEELTRVEVFLAQKSEPKK